METYISGRQDILLNKVVLQSHNKTLQALTEQHEVMTHPLLGQIIETSVRDPHGMSTRPVHR